MPWTTGTLILDTIVRDDHKNAQTIYNLLLATPREKQTFRCLRPDHRVASYPEGLGLAKARLAIIGRFTSSSEAPDTMATRNTNVIGRRIVACLLDCTLVAGLSLVTLTPLLFVRLSLVVVLLLLLLFVLVFCVFYFVYATVFDGFRGQTLGKALCGISVIREEDGGMPGPGRAALRATMFLFVDMIAGIFMMLASPKRQRLGDIAANTLVVRK